MFVQRLAKLLSDPTVDHNLVWEEERPTCHLTNEFWLLANEHVHVDEPPSDTRSLNDFPLVKIKKFMIHDKDEPILTYDQLSLWDALEGVVWHLVSDVFWKKRNGEWVRQCLQLVELLFMRCRVISDYRDAPLNVLNVRRYRDEYELNNNEEAIAAHVTWKFLFETSELIIQALRTCCDEKAHWDRVDPIVVSQEPVTVLRKYIRTSSSSQREESVIIIRREYLENLFFVPAYERIFRLSNRNSSRIKTREVLVYKNDRLYDVNDHIHSKAEILAARRINDEREQIMQRVSIDSLLSDLVRSQKWKLPIVYVRTLAVWYLEATDQYFESYTEAFARFRRNTPEKKEFSAFDAYILDVEGKDLHLLSKKEVITDISKLKRRNNTLKNDISRGDDEEEEEEEEDEDGRGKGNSTIATKRVRKT